MIRAGSPQSGRARGRRGITRLRKRSADDGDTEPEGEALAMEREVRRYNRPENREALWGPETGGRANSAREPNPDLLC